MPRIREPVTFAPETAGKSFDPALAPFWRSETVTELAIFIQDAIDARPRARLLFRPDEVLRLTGATRETVYERGRDYTIDPKSGTLVLSEESRVPFKAIEELVAMRPPKDLRPSNDLSELHFHQVEVTYTRTPDQWLGYAPAIAETQLPKTLKIVRAGGPLKLLLMGDSIAEGYGSSNFMKAAPAAPAFGEQVAMGLARASGAAVIFDNVAHAQWPSYMGADQVVQEGLGARQPDLAVVAFGMNDIVLGSLSGERRRGPSDYGASIRAIVDAIRVDLPETEFILVSSLCGNAHLDSYPADQFPIYRDEIAKLAGPGVAFADMTAMYEAMLRQKSFFDLSDGLNHPNDFGHRVYAQVILSLLIDPAI